ncbi:hypothetical protein [Nitrososphaera sp.]|uniref:hypothetical protein n=1 Tax=Nitrososphaera sp. TaxID=1971748 RepID=UPI00307E228A
MDGVSKVAIAAVGVAALFIVFLLYNATVMAALGIMGDERKIVQLQKGGVLNTPFTRGSLDGIDAMKGAYPSWYFDGSARVRGGSYDVHQVAGEGLYVGVSDPDPDDPVWSGIFAMSPNDYSSLYHVRMDVPGRLPVSSDPADYMNVGMYVQTDTSTGRINYVGCTIDIRPDSLILRVESGLGNDMLVTSRTVHWEKRVGLDERTVDCTLVTNGDNRLLAIINGDRVFESNRLDLQMPRPFNSYLETQVRGITELSYGRFSDYYSSLSDEVTVIKLKPGQQVSLGNATAVADGSGIARINISKAGGLKCNDNNIGAGNDGSGCRLVVHGSPDSVLVKSDFSGGDLYSYGPIDWIEESKYSHRADSGGKLG